MRSMKTTRAIALSALACAMALSLAACGNKGALVQAPVPEAATPTVPAPTVNDALEPNENPGAPQSNLPEPPAQPAPQTDDQS